MLFVVLLHLTAVSAYDMRWLTLRSGLPGVSVICMAEDPSGLVWIGTSNGVALYNGKSLKNYALPRKTDDKANHCFDLAVDNGGNLWAGTSDGVYMLPRQAEAFQAVATGLLGIEAVQCRGDSVFVGCRTGLFVINRHTLLTTQIDISAGQTRSNNSVRCLRLQNDTLLWATVRTGLACVNLDNGTTRFVPFETPSGLSRFDLCQGQLFVGTKNNGLYRIDAVTGKGEKIDEVPNVVSAVATAPDSLSLCVATNGGGAYMIEAATGRVLLHYDALDHDDAQPKLPTSSVQLFRQTADGILWIGLFKGGLMYTERCYNVFSPYTLDGFTTRGKRISAALVQGHLRLLATDGGLWLCNELTHVTTYFDTRRWRMMNINHLFAHNGHIYIGSYDGGLLCLDPRKGLLSRVPDSPELEFASIADLTTDAGGRLWVASSEGLFVIDDGRMVRRYTEKNSRLLLNVKSIRFDSEGKAWVGTARGLCLYLPREDDFKTDGFPLGFWNQERDLHIILRGDTVFGVGKMKLFVSDIGMQHFGGFSMPASVLNEECRSFLPLADGVALIVTERGLFRVDNHYSTPVQFAESSGLSGNMLSSGSLGMDSTWVWIGTNDGLMLAQRSRVTSGTLGSTTASITLDYLFDGERMLTKGQTMAVNDTHTLSAGWNLWMRKLAVCPVFTDFSAHTDDFFEYRVDDGNWLTQTLGQVIELTGMMPGVHRLQMRIPGIEHEPAEYTVMVKPTTAFYVQAVVLLVGLALLLWWYRWRKGTKRLLSEHRQTEQALIAEIEEKQLAANSEAEPEKYRNSSHNEKELERVFTLMDQYVRQNRPYLNSELKMSDIAVAIGESPSMLSQVFTLYLKKPYYDYINMFRLEEFKKLIEQGKYYQFTVLALSEQCGFKKTSFFSTFRKMEGMTPTEFIRKQ